MPYHYKKGIKPNLYTLVQNEYIKGCSLCSGFDYCEETP